MAPWAEVSVSAALQGGSFGLGVWGLPELYKPRLLRSLAKASLHAYKYKICIYIYVYMYVFTYLFMYMHPKP